MVQAELQESVKELTKSRKKYQEAETMAQAVREKAELDAKYEPIFCCLFYGDVIQIVTEILIIILYVFAVCQNYSCLMLILAA